jgi:hypothetical protein
MPGMGSRIASWRAGAEGIDGTGSLHVEAGCRVVLRIVRTRARCSCGCVLLVTERIRRADPAAGLGINRRGGAVVWCGRGSHRDIAWKINSWSDLLSAGGVRCGLRFSFEIRRIENFQARVMPWDRRLAVLAGARSSELRPLSGD